MSTSGAFGFRENGKEYFNYVNFDANPGAFIPNIKFLVYALGWPKVEQEMQKTKCYSSICFVGAIIDYIGQTSDRKLKMHLPEFWRQLKLIEQRKLGEYSPQSEHCKSLGSSLKKMKREMDLQYIYTINKNSIRYNDVVYAIQDKTVPLAPDEEMKKTWILGRLLELG